MKLLVRLHSPLAAPRRRRRARCARDRSRRRRPSGTCRPPTRRPTTTPRTCVQFANDVDKATGGKLKITVHRQRVAVQGRPDQARRPGRAGADRRGAARQLPERMAAVRHRRPAVPRRQLRRFDEALQGVEAGAREEARRAGNHAALHGAVAAAGHLRQEADRLGGRPEGREVARLQPGDGAHRRARRRPAGDGAGRRAVAGAGDRRRRELHVVGLDRLRQQDLRAHQVLVRHAGLAAEERRPRQQGGVRRARQGDAGRRAQGGRRRRGARLGRSRRRRTASTSTCSRRTA